MEELLNYCSNNIFQEARQLATQKGTREGQVREHEEKLSLCQVIVYDRH